MKQLSDNGYYGSYGGMFIPEILFPAFRELKKTFAEIQRDTSFWRDYQETLANFSGRPTPLTYAAGLTEYFGGPRIYMKREDLNHSGAHKMNNALGQAMLAKRMNKTRVIAETGAGQHGVATAIVGAKFGLDVTVYMGREDVERQYANVFWMRRFGAEVVPVETGSRTLKDAMNEALRDWAASFETTHYLLGTASGPHPFPALVAFLQSIIGNEAREQILRLEGKLPRRIYACVGGGSNALGIFQAFMPYKEVELVGVEAGGEGPIAGKHAARIAYGQGRAGIAQGYKSLFLQNDDGQMIETASIAAGLDYTGVSPLLANLSMCGRVRFEAATNEEVINALQLVMTREGIVPALESTHAFAGAFREIQQCSKDDSIIINLSGRGDKDIFTIAEGLQDEGWKAFIQRKNTHYQQTGSGDSEKA
ncbi:MAG TPA: tryptophan synthase subunit beta [Ktedonobacteraceae bacterium]|jgi:tryptophan synthase beta chain